MVPKAGRLPVTGDKHLLLGSWINPVAYAFLIAVEAVSSFTFSPVCAFVSRKTAPRSAASCLQLGTRQRRVQSTAGPRGQREGLSGVGAWGWGGERGQAPTASGFEASCGPVPSVVLWL